MIRSIYNASTFIGSLLILLWMPAALIWLTWDQWQPHQMTVTLWLPW